MTYSLLKKIISIIFTIISLFFTAAGELWSSENAPGILYLRSVVRVTEPSAPWRIPVIRQMEGTAVIVGKNWVFTDLELVRYSVYLEIRNPLTGAVTEASVKYKGFDSGLAILEPKDPQVLSGLTGYDLTDSVPHAGEEVVLTGVTGWSGKIIRFNERIQSVRTDLPVFSHTDMLNLYYFREPASVPVKSGSAVLKDQKLAAVYCSYPEKGSHYAIDAGEIRRFLADIGDGTYNGKPVFEATVTPVTNPLLRRYYLLSEGENGLAVTRLAPGYTPLREGDVILKIGDMAVNESGFIGQSGSSVTLKDYLRGLTAGDTKMTVKRAGVLTEITVTLRADSYRRKSTDPTVPYFLSGGLAFAGLDFSQMEDPEIGGNISALYRYRYRVADRLYLETDQDIVFLGALDDASVKDFGSFKGFIVYRINGQRVRSLKDFADKWKNITERRIIIEFINQSEKIVIEREDAAETDRRINERYRPQENGRVY